MMRPDDDGLAYQADFRAAYRGTIRALLAANRGEGDAVPNRNQTPGRLTGCNAATDPPGLVLYLRARVNS